MAFNLGSPVSTDNIRVGYIDPSLGFVDGLTVCQANDYAVRNPGTIFIFRDGRNNIRYLNINEVNRLTPQDTISVIVDECGGITYEKVCGPPVVTFYGGGGVGAQGNPIIGNDGSILAIDVVRRGHGYAFPPGVIATDDCNIGTGAVFRVLLGDIADQEETFTREEDFEEYEICSFEDIGYGINWGPNGEDLGAWSPKLFLPGLASDPIAREINKYQTAIRDKEKFFNTRVKRPSRVQCLSNPRVNVGTYPVSYITNPDERDPKRRSPWSDFMNTFAISPVPPSNVRGSDFAAEIFSFEWNIDFPYDGEYEFRGCKDNISRLYFDEEFISELDGFNKNPKMFKKYITEGNHNIRVELTNAPIYEDKVEVVALTSAAEQPAGGYFWKKGDQYYLKVGGNDLVGLQFNLNFNDNSFIAGTAIKKITIPSHDGKVVLQRDGAIGPRFSVSAKGVFKANKDYGPIIFEGRASGSPPPEIVNTGDPKKDPGTFQQRINFFEAAGRKFIDSGKDGKLTIVQRSGSASLTLIPPPEQKSPPKEGGVAVTTQQQVQVQSQREEWVKVDDAFVPPGQGLVRNSRDNSLFSERANRDSLFSTLLADYTNASFHRYNEGTFYKGKRIRSGGDWNDTNPNTNYIQWDENTRLTLGTYYPDRGQRFGISVWQRKIVTDTQTQTVNVPQTKTIITKVLSPKSWNENPMGVALSIIPPDPPIPQEPKPKQEGRCPPNPIWSTRYPGAEKQWYPCKFRSPGVITETVTKEVSKENTNQTQSSQEVEFSLYRQGGGNRNSGGITFTLIPVGGKGSPVTLTHNGKGKTNITQKVKIEKNVTYRVVASLNSRAPATAVALEQGLISAKGKEIKSGETGKKVFADILPSANDNDDLIITAPSGGGKFISGKKSKVSGGGQTRNTYELTFILESNAKTSKPETVTKTRKVNVNGWSRFMNRYALSPVKPLDDPGTDGAGVTYTNSWIVDVPFEGFYSLRGLGDNSGRILLDGQEVYKLGGFQNENPEDKRLYLTKGSKRITVEIYNKPIIQTKIVKKKIFNSKDWQVSTFVAPPKTTQVKFDVTVTGQYANSFEIRELGVSLSKQFNGAAKNKSITANVEYGKVYIVKLATSRQGSIKLRTQGDSVLQAEDATDFNWQDIQCAASQGKFYDLQGDTCKFVVGSPTTSYKTLSSGTVKNGVTYSGPELFHYVDNRWGSFMNEYSISPYLPPLDSDNPAINGVRTYTWSNIEFPVTGQYEIIFQADNNGSLIIGGQKVLASDGYTGTGQRFNVNISKGTYDVVVEMENTPDFTNIFFNNPVGLSLLIEKDIEVTTNLSARPDGPAWTTNPIGVSAALISPPCPKKISGRGVVQEVIVDDPGNGYIPQTSNANQYPVTLRLKSVEVENPGINYNCGVDQIVITPNNGAELEYTCDSFGRINSVNVVKPGSGFTEYPTITMVTPAVNPDGTPGVPTGVNASFRPQFEVVRDPVEAITGTLPPEQLIQVTDLVGLKQTGYVDGRAYFGAVYFENGQRFAGYYKTVGTPVRVYDTLIESINAEVTTRPDAIQRQGTDIRSNDPRLNIPNTPQDLT